MASLGLRLPSLQEHYLIDVTPDVGDQLHHLGVTEGHEGVNRNPLAGVFLTHAHIGHYLGLAHFGFEAVHTHNLPVYATPELGAFLRDNAPWDQLVKLGNIVLMPTRPGQAVTVGPVAITPVIVPHRDEYANTVAYRIEGPKRTVLYLPDVAPWSTFNAEANALLSSADVLILDGTFFSRDELPGRSLDQIGHPLVTDTMDRLQKRVRAGKVEVMFTHLNHSNPAVDPESPQAQTVEKRGFRILADGDHIEL